MIGIEGLDEQDLSDLATWRPSTPTWLSARSTLDPTQRPTPSIRRRCQDYRRRRFRARRLEANSMAKFRYAEDAVATWHGESPAARADWAWSPMRVNCLIRVDSTQSVRCTTTTASHAAARVVQKLGACVLMTPGRPRRTDELQKAKDNQGHEDTKRDEIRDGVADCL